MPPHPAIRVSPLQFSDCFRAMDTQVDVTIAAPAPDFAALASVRLLFERQEQLFSRFRPGSLLSALNRGEPVSDARFAIAIRLALEAFEFTGGLFNPMILAALRDAGYDTTFASVRGGAPRPQPVPDPREAVSLAGETVQLREGQLDLGGIVKGWTVDLAANLLEEKPGVLVNAGGDLRAAGAEEGVAGWVVGVESPAGGAAWEGVMRGAVCTSTTLRRRWSAATGPAHHLVDPRSGLPATSPFVQVSAWAPEAWRAECWAKAVLIGGEPTLQAATRAGVRLLAFTPEGLAYSSAP